MSKGSNRRRGEEYSAGYDLIWSKVDDDEPKCSVCGATVDEPCVCLPTDDGPQDDDQPVRRRFDKGE